ncbi:MULTISPECIES: PAAR domain-containing protein [Enterobacter cloacae complex]|nr:MULTISPECIES: PAAR domain-containing protein [Enterobacter cloacae complex]MCD2458513.1 PAAR domain-containing protein [Enterobacter cloacae complex sp. 2021EL-01261]MDT9873677.1 PAAR domain-containing protein [Enterobacter cloacae]
MATGYYLRVGDKTTCGGKILTGTPEIDWYGANAAREGDFVSCGKNPGVSYKIIGGTEGFMDKTQQLAGTLDSISSCPCKAKFIPSKPDCYEKETVSSPGCSGVAAVAPVPAALMPTFRSEPEQHAQTAKKKTGIDAGFVVIPYGGTTEAWQRLLFTENPPAGAKELFATLNGPDERYKAGSIMLVVDPDKQDNEQIAHMKAAKARVDAALAPLSIQQASFLFRHKDTIEMFAAAASTASDTYGYSGQATEAAKGYFSRIEKILVEIETTYKNHYITSGALIGEQFFVERRHLFGQLDSVLKVFMKHRFMFNEYTDLKSALGLSSRSITHR